MEKKEYECKRCAACTHKVREYWNFCPKCGNQLKEHLEILSAQQIQALRSGSQTRSRDNK